MSRLPNKPATALSLVFATKSFFDFFLRLPTGLFFCALVATTVALIDAGYSYLGSVITTNVTNNLICKKRDLDTLPITDSDRQQSLITLREACKLILSILYTGAMFYLNTSSDIFSDERSQPLHVSTLYLVLDLMRAYTNFGTAYLGSELTDSLLTKVGLLPTLDSNKRIQNALSIQLTVDSVSITLKHKLN